MPEHTEVDQIWTEFWVPVMDAAVEGLPLGQSIAIPGVYFEQIKRELFDYHKLLHEVYHERG